MKNSLKSPKTFDLQILEYTINNGGITIDRNMNKPKSGYMVNIRPSQSKRFNLNESKTKLRLEIRKSYTELLTIPDNNAYLGIWIHKDKIFIEISHRYDSKEVAMQLSQDFNQLAIFDLNANKEIFI